MGGSLARGSHGTVLPLSSSTAIPQAQAKLGLPAAPVHNSVNQLVDKAPHVPAQGGPKQLYPSLLIQAELPQAGCDKAVHCRCFLGILKDLSQLLIQPGQQGMEDRGVDVEEECPGVGMEAIHWSHGQLLLARVLEGDRGCGWLGDWEILLSGGQQVMVPQVEG